MLYRKNCIVFEFPKYVRISRSRFNSIEIPVRIAFDDGYSMHNAFMNEMSQEIAIQAARWIVEEGLDYGAAKRRAAKELGLSANKTPMPSNDVVEQEVIEYLRLFCAQTQPLELLALRQTALLWMQRMEQFRPHLSGAVWRGTATRLNDIYIQLFCNDSKEAEIELINKGVDFEVRAISGFRGEEVDALSLSTYCEGLKEEVGLHFIIYDHDDLRGALSGGAKSRDALSKAPKAQQGLDENLLSPVLGDTVSSVPLPKSSIGSLKALGELLA